MQINNEIKMSENTNPQTVLSKDEEIKLMLQHGLHYGHKRTYFHPSMRPYVIGLKDGIYIINLEKTYEKLQEVLNLLKELKEQNKVILFIGTLPHFRQIISSFAERIKMPYVVERWIGGLISNYEIISKSLKNYLELKEKKEKGEWNTILKKERVKLEKKLARLAKKFESLRLMTRLPDAIFVFNIKGNLQAIREAKKKNVKVFALADTDANIKEVDYFIPTNDNSLNCIKYLISKLETIFDVKD